MGQFYYLLKAHNLLLQRPSSSYHPKLHSIQAPFSHTSQPSPQGLLGLSVGLGVGLGFGLAVGLSVGLGVGLGVAGAFSEIYYMVSLCVILICQNILYIIPTNNLWIIRRPTFACATGSNMYYLFPMLELRAVCLASWSRTLVVLYTDNTLYHIRWISS